MDGEKDEQRGQSSNLGRAALVKEKSECCEKKGRKIKVQKAMRRAEKIKRGLDKGGRDGAMEREV